MRQLLGLAVIAAIGVGVYLYFFNPDQLGGVKGKAIRDIDMKAADFYKRADVKFNANSWQAAIDDFKKAIVKDVKESGKDRPNPVMGAQAMYRIASSYDNMAKNDSANPKKGEWEQQAAHWFKRFMQYYEGHSEYGNRAARKLQELESTGVKGNAELAD